MIELKKGVSDIKLYDRKNSNSLDQDSIKIDEKHIDIKVIEDKAKEEMKEFKEYKESRNRENDLNREKDREKSKETEKESLLPKFLNLKDVTLKDIEVSELVDCCNGEKMRIFIMEADLQAKTK
eukprot:CAMPEP_0116923734 /NCGR_PEP_ID=MMETSP0467-20121206/23068_1 /TAXON_ID=283647 /ORGANISM="Mesodinium pulex, Strain SPMC105" /LENGTH=123 /DNA_ID=CAMNT_0004602381 /DNA_START=930 /DNA_END=1301 /DNA_ORIENTATION=-